MQKIHSGKLRALSYDPQKRNLRVQFDDGSLWEYSGVNEEVWRRLRNSGAAWSYFRDNIEEECTGKRVSTVSEKLNRNPLEDLFK